MAADGPVKQILFHESGVISVSPRSVHMNKRTAVCKWHTSHVQMVDLQCATFTSNPDHILVAGYQPIMLLIDVISGNVIKEVPAYRPYKMMKRSKFICAATEDAAVDFLDPSTFMTTGHWKAPYNSLLNMDARNEFLVVCGSTSRIMGAAVAASFASVYDLKQIKALAPIPFHAGAAFVCLHPQLQTTSFVASSTGQIHVVDLMNPNIINLKQANVDRMVQMELASSGENLAILDQDLSLHLWGSPTKVRFSKQTQETEFPDEQMPNPPHIDWKDSPLSAVGMPYYSDKLLSAWDSRLIFDVGAPPSVADHSIFPYMQPAELGQGGPWPRRAFRYQVENTRHMLLESSLAAPKFLSEKAKETPRSRSKTGSRISEATEALADAALNEKGEEDPVLKYGNVEIKYSKFGVDDFDFRYYNKTIYSGLETHITNSYLNALLQLYRFTPLVRNLALHHTATSCDWENCLLCELGFVVDMLEKANGANCQATNLLRTFGSSREASNLNLLEQNTPSISTNLSFTVQAANRFLLNQISQDFKRITGSTDSLDLLLNTAATEVIRCMVCHNETSHPRKTYVNELVYPNQDPKGTGNQRAFKFSSLLKASIEKQSAARGWCERCHRYQPQTFIRRNFQHIPQALMINASAPNPKTRHIWASRKFLPKEIGILILGDSMHIVDGFELEAKRRQKSQDFVIYELVGYVAEVKIADHDRPHLISVINTDISKPSMQPVNSNRTTSESWHLFNDFLVASISEEEALSFPESTSSFKTPNILTYQIRSAHGAIDDTWRASLDTTLLYSPWSVNQIPPQSSCKILDPATDSLSPGFPIALDTEFVELEPPVFEMSSSNALRTDGNAAGGEAEMVRPSKSALARVSVLRGNPAPDNQDLLPEPGIPFGVPFIDDYITTPHGHIHDYKTQFSGIWPGDLDPARSTHNLVPLKVAYKKLWLLLNLGCVFVGHGLAADFRKINLQVPKAQVRDTVTLYAKEGEGRLLSLRFLAWVVFSEWIQEEGVIEGHDSVEDAMMALRLWKRWEGWEEKGADLRREMVEGIWRDGERVRFRPPRRPGRGAGSEATGVGSGRNTPDPGLAGTRGGLRAAAPGFGGSPLR
ncbi:MAG: hypothetical protein Q9227_004984 [Pyrenula ochraceoflavens]